MANIMKEVANALGVELEEEFNLKGFTNKYQLSKDGLMHWSDTRKEWIPSCNLLDEILTGKQQIVKLPKQIIDEKEKEYLSNVIKPFRNRIIWIGKAVYIPGEYIEIYLRHYDDGCSSYSIILPYFKKGTMYKGMELDKEYTLEELGL